MYGGIGKCGSVQTFAQYREAEAVNQTRRAVNNEGDLLDYETLELRVHPPNVEVKVEGKETLITVDSANRPGTLIEVVQTLTELGTEIAKARITSDGGWFVDEFVIHERHGRPVTCPRKLATIRKVLNVNFETDDSTSAENDIVGPSTVLELAGQDRTGLLADVVSMLTSNGCIVWSAAVWTYRNRVAFVLSLTDNGRPLSDPSKKKALSNLLLEMMDKNGNGIVKFSDVLKQRQVHHERRLHNLLLEEEMHLYDAAMLESERAGKAFAYHIAAHVPELDSPYVSTKYCQPTVMVTDSPAKKYWFVTIRCMDRNKLLFDTVCTLSDLEFDVWHATIDSERQSDNTLIANQEFYVRPRFGVAEFDAAKADRLKWMLTAAILRRFPKGIKLHVQSHMRMDLSQLTSTLKESRLTVVRAKVKPTSDSFGHSAHTFYVMDESGAPPDLPAVEKVCRAAGGNLIKTGDSVKSNGNSLEGHKFSFSFIERNWRKEWGVGSQDSSSGVTP